MQTHNTDLWTIRLSVALVTGGCFLFAYGALGTTPILTASLLGVPQEFHEAIRLFVPQSVFFTGCLLIIGGAGLDVWRRFQK